MVPHDGVARHKTSAARVGRAADGNAAENLSNLPPREILLNRRGISRHFRDMIDLEENHGPLVGGSIAALLSRLNAFIKRYCEFAVEFEDDEPDAFLHAIFDYICLRGLDKHYSDKYVIDMFMEFWLERSDQASDSKPFSQYFIVRCTDEFVAMFGNLPNHFVFPSDSYFYVKYAKTLETIYARTEAFIQDFDGERIEERRESIMEEKYRVMDDYDPTAGRTADLECLRRTLGVPPFSVSSPHASLLSKEWALAKLELAKKQNITLKGIERAVVLEEISIH
ncbi:hypothetical protein BST61_g11596 [Cercospora zeina]